MTSALQNCSTDTCNFEATFKRELEGVDPKELVREGSLDLWVCHHFRVLPTEERFKRLTPRQKEFLYLGWVELPSSDQIKAWYDGKKDDPVIGSEESSNFKRLGYTSEQIKRMKDQLKKAGFRQE